MSKQPQQKSRLGRGLSSLIGMNPLPETPVSVELPAPGGSSPHPSPELPGIRVLEIPLDKLSANPHQPRRSFDEASLQSLAASLKVTGVIQPIVARGTEDGSYELIAGERRWRAAKLAGLQTIPAIVRSVDPITQAQMALIENIQRQDLNPVDRAHAYKLLLDNLGLTQSELADRLGEDRTVIGHFLRLLDLAPWVQTMVSEGRLGLSHAKLLAGVTDLAEQTRLANLVVTQDLNVRNLERLLAVAPAPAPAKDPETPQPASAHLADLEKNLSRQLGMRIQVKSGKRKGTGKLILHYANLDQFDDVVSKLGLSVD